MHRRPTELSRLDDAFIREMLARGEFKQLPFKSMFPSNGHLTVYAKTPNGWAQMAPQTLERAMRTRGPNSTTPMFRSIFGSMVDPQNYQTLKKQLMTQADKQDVFNDMFGDALGVGGEDAETIQTLFESLFGGEERAPVTGLYKKASQPTYAMVVKLPRGVLVKDVFSPVNLPPKEAAFMPSEKVVRETLEATFMPSEKVVQQTLAQPQAALDDKQTYVFRRDEDTPPDTPPDTTPSDTPPPRTKQQPPLLLEDIDSPPPYIDTDTSAVKLDGIMDIQTPDLSILRDLI